MKKLLSLLATVSLVSTTTASVVACGNENNDLIDEGEDDVVKQDISTIISVTNLGNINFYSLNGQDDQTQGAIFNQIRNLNPNIGNAQITVTDINWANRTAIISAEGFSGSVSVSFTPIISIDLIITNTILGDIDFNSLTGNDAQTQNTIITQIRNLNPNIDNAQITVTDINRANGTAIISAENFAGTVEVTFAASSIIDDIEIPSSINFPPTPNTALQLQNGATLVGGGDTYGNSFLSTFNLNDSNPETEILKTNLTPNTISYMIQLRDGRVLATGGQLAGPSSFLSIINFSDSTLQVQNIIPTNFAPWVVNSMIELQDGRILITGGSSAANSFLTYVDLSGSTPQNIAALPVGSFPSIPRSIIELQDGRILITGGTTVANSFLISVDLSGETPQIETLLTGFAPAQISSMIQIQNGRILITGGTTVANSFLISVDLSGETPQIETLLTGFAPAQIRSMIKLQNERILIIGFSMINWEEISFLMLI